MTLTGNKGEWSEPYVLLKLIADRKIHLGDANFEKIANAFYPILSVLRHQKDSNLEFMYDDEIVLVKDGQDIVRVSIAEFVMNARKCFDIIKVSSGVFEINEIESFLNRIKVNTVKTKAQQKNDITIRILDEKSFLNPSLGFSVKSQAGQASTLVNASGSTNFIYRIEGKVLTSEETDKFEEQDNFSKKFSYLKSLGCYLVYEGVQEKKFKSNLKNIDYYFDTILANMLVRFYTDRSNNSVPNYIDKITEENPLKYDLDVNDDMYRMAMKLFLKEYALGMRAATVWKRKYEATGGYIIVRPDGELICYHFYFQEEFEAYLYNNTMLESPSPSRHGYGSIYEEDGVQKIKLNLQIRFIK